MRLATRKQRRADRPEKSAEQRHEEAMARVKAFKQEFERMTPAQQDAVRVIAGRIQGYSEFNRVLIVLQARVYGFEPSAVATFKAWLNAGRVVRKGCRALFIYAPCLGKKSRAPQPEDGAIATQQQVEWMESDEEEESRARYFRLVPVFDLSQTDKKPLEIEGGAA